MNLFQNLIGYTTNDEGYIFEMDITIAKEKEEGKRKPTIEIDEKILQNKPFVDKVVYSKNKRIFESKLLVSNELGYTMNNILNNYETIIKCIRKRKLELDSITEEMEEDNQKSYYDNTTHEYIEEINDPIWLEIFRDLKKDLIIEDGIIYIAKEDIENFFDPYVYYDEKYNQIITTSGKQVTSMVIGEEYIVNNGARVEISGTVLERDDTYYIPFSSLKGTYNVDINYIESTNTVIVDS